MDVEVCGYDKNDETTFGGVELPLLALLSTENVHFAPPTLPQGVGETFNPADFPTFSMTFPKIYSFRGFSFRYYGFRTGGHFYVRFSLHIQLFRPIMYNDAENSVS